MRIIPIILLLLLLPPSVTPLTVSGEIIGLAGNDTELIYFTIPGSDYGPASITRGNTTRYELTIPQTTAGKAGTLLYGGKPITTITIPLNSTQIQENIVLNPPIRRQTPTFTCDPGLKRCAEDGVETCTPSGIWNITTPCPNGCIPTSFICVAPPSCTPGVRTCNFDRVRECALDGRSWIVKDQCDTACFKGKCYDNSSWDNVTATFIGFSLLTLGVLLLWAQDIVKKKGKPGRKKNETPKER